MLIAATRQAGDLDGRNPAGRSWRQSLGTVHPLTCGAEAADLRQATPRHARAIGDAFSDAVADHHEELARFAFRLCGDRILAEDIVAEVYARVWPHWQRGRVAELLPYLMRAVANEAFTRHRRRRLERSKEPPAPLLVVGPFEARVDDTTSCGRPWAASHPSGGWSWSSGSTRTCPRSRRLPYWAYHPEP